MNANLQNALSSLNLASIDFDNLEQTNGQMQDTINALKQQLSTAQAQKRVIVPAINLLPPEMLWYEARDAAAPKTGPHGTCTFTPGEPSTYDFRPINLGGFSDNVYGLHRLAQYLPQDVIIAAKQFAANVILSANPTSNVQALEFDYQRQLGTQVENFSFQLDPVSPTAMQVRSFNYAAKDWEPIGLPTIPFTTDPIPVRGEWITDGKVVTMTKIFIKGTSFVPNFQHSVVTKTGAAANLVSLNTALQLDAKAAGLAYKATAGKYSIELQ